MNWVLLTGWHPQASDAQLLYIDQLSIYR